MSETIKRSANHTNSRINANIYSVIEAVNSSIAPGEEELVPWIVKHIIETCNAEQIR